MPCLDRPAVLVAGSAVQRSDTLAGLQAKEQDLPLVCVGGQPAAIGRRGQAEDGEGAEIVEQVLIEVQQPEMQPGMRGAGTESEKSGDAERAPSAMKTRVRVLSANQPPT